MQRPGLLTERIYGDRVPSLQRLRGVGVLAGERFEVRVQQRQPDFDGFAALTFPGGLAFGEVLAFVGSAGRLERVLDELVRDPGALEIQRVRDLLGFSQGQVADGSVSADFIGDVSRHGVPG